VRGSSCNGFLEITGKEALIETLHNSYFLKEGGLFFSSKALGLVFSATYLWGSFTPSALPPDLGSGDLRFPPLISCEKTAPLRQSLQKSPPSFLELQRLLGCAKISYFIWSTEKAFGPETGGLFYNRTPSLVYQDKIPLHENFSIFFFFCPFMFPLFRHGDDLR